MRRRIAILSIVFVIALVLLGGTSARVAHASTYSRAKTRKTITKAAKFWHLKPSEAKWLRRAAVDVIYGPGAHESNGSGHTGHRNKAGCVGIVQLSPSFHLGKVLTKRSKRVHHKHPHGWRCCAQCSLYRFVLVYKQGGKAKIRQHWAATYGR